MQHSLKESLFDLPTLQTLPQGHKPNLEACSAQSGLHSECMMSHSLI